jgi:hypothetical protein
VITVFLLDRFFYQANFLLNLLIKKEFNKNKINYNGYYSFGILLLKRLALKGEVLS